MNHLRLLRTLKPCGRKTCLCVEELKTYLIKIPLTKEEEEENNLDIEFQNEHYKCCYYTWESFNKKNN